VSPARLVRGRLGEVGATTPAVASHVARDDPTSRRSGRVNAPHDPFTPVLKQLEATSAVALVGKYDLDRICLYAALVGEEGAIHELRGRSAEAGQCYHRSLAFYAAASSAGAHLQPADVERIALLYPKVKDVGLDNRYEEEIRRLLGRPVSSPPRPTMPKLAEPRDTTVAPVATVHPRSRQGRLAAIRRIGCLVLIVLVILIVVGVNILRGVRLPV
jgi:hypothetical protein